ncbi:sorbitol transporter [Iris pallida]|uniref:Sorbitol transporter n=1 Tax=Iris pallida TaxID=29817 RepID=A0AAX6FER2_IRIPA|nr:sorbitol transporter [Iris pallida]
MVTTPLATLFVAAPKLAPCALSLVGKISEPYTHAIGPSPTENAPTNDSTVPTHNATAQALASSPSGVRSIARRPDASSSSDTTIPPALDSSSGLLPTLSSRKAATSMNEVFAKPTAIVAPSSWSFLLSPAFSNTLGLYRTTESIPEACWKKCSPTAARSTRRTAGVGLTSSSFHTPSPRFLPGTGTTSPPRPPGAPTAFLMSARRCPASSGESDVLASTASASAVLPCMTSHRGDSGIASTPAARKTGGTAPARNITRQLRCPGSFAKAKLETKPSSTPKLPNTSGSEERKPREEAGAISAA